MSIEAAAREIVSEAIRLMPIGIFDEVAVVRILRKHFPAEPAGAAPPVRVTRLPLRFHSGEPAAAEHPIINPETVTFTEADRSLIERVEKHLERAGFKPAAGEGESQKQQSEDIADVIEVLAMTIDLRQSHMSESVRGAIVGCINVLKSLPAVPAGTLEKLEAENGRLKTRIAELANRCLAVRDALNKYHGSKLQSDCDELERLAVQCNSPDLLDDLRLMQNELHAKEVARLREYLKQSYDSISRLQAENAALRAKGGG